MDSLPSAGSKLWSAGFVWKGVFLRLLSKKGAKGLKAEIKALKHLAIEYFQSDFLIKYYDCQQVQSFHSQKHYNNSDLNAQEKPQLLNHQIPSVLQQYSTIALVLPLISYVESSSWVLYGSPVVYHKKN